MPKISVIMPVYNTQESFLREAIESILNQTYCDFEFLIIDDGSVNNAADVIHSYNDDRIKYIKNEKNLGIIKTLNKGLELMQGEYIARIDSDDVALAERFEKQVKFLDENPNISILCSRFQWFPKDRIITPPVSDKQIKENLLLSTNVIGHSTVMIRTDFIKKFNLRYDDEFKYCEDYRLWLDAIDKTKFACLPEILVKYRIHENSVCQKNIDTQHLNVQKAMFLAQGKFFNIKNEDAVSTIEKLIQGQKMNSDDLQAMESFVNAIIQAAKKDGIKCNYNLNRSFYKIALKNCKKDLKYLKILWQSKLNKVANIKISTKIVNTLRFF